MISGSGICEGAIFIYRKAAHIRIGARDWSQLPMALNFCAAKFNAIYGYAQNRAIRIGAFI